MKHKLLSALFSIAIIIGCRDEKVIHDSTTDMTSPVVEEVKQPSIDENAFYIPLSQKSGGGNEFVAFLPDGKFIRGEIDYNGGDWLYYQNNKSEYSGSYKVTSENIVEVTEVFKGNLGGKYTWNFKLSKIDTYFGNQAYELRAIQKNGKLTQDPSMWFTSADINVAPRIKFE